MAAKNSSLAVKISENFEQSLNEVKVDIGWDDNKSIEEWLKEPSVQQKLIKDMRRKSLEEIKKINLGEFLKNFFGNTLNFLTKTN